MSDVTPVCGVPKLLGSCYGSLCVSQMYVLCTEALAFQLAVAYRLCKNIFDNRKIYLYNASKSCLKQVANVLTADTCN